MEVAKILSKVPKENIYGIMGNLDLTTNNEGYSIINAISFRGTVKEYLDSPKSSASLKMVLLDDTYLNKTASECSISTLKKIDLAKSLIKNDNVIVLNYFDKELNKEEKEYFKLFFKKLVKNYHKTILIYTNDLEFIWNVTSKIFIYKDNLLKSYPTKDLNTILNFVDKPDLVKIVDLIKSKDKKINYYKDVDELLKAIYRLKCAK